MYNTALCFCLCKNCSLERQRDGELVRLKSGEKLINLWQNELSPCVKIEMS